ncbi:GntR family transcriptional regulator [Klugiella xanthotipulae]|uniref:FadR/GntR family transcriptional regulator n=1 Tax=Klugiella xanthotipulae TaxID=244735 RepID=UPI001476A802|nr:GntR family transcriptional regulator [Klugiella xanthotipulae]
MSLTMTELRSRIRSGAWPVNSRIPTEAELAELFGVGRSTIREAVRSLANLGMLETAAGRGTFVRSLAPVPQVVTETLGAHRLADILGFRRALEVEAARLAALHATDEGVARLRALIASEAAALGRAEHDRVEHAQSRAVERGVTPGAFHFAVVEMSSNTLLTEMYASVMMSLRTGLASGAVIHGASHAVRQEDHTALLTALDERDAEAAARAAARHSDRDLVVASEPTHPTTPPPAATG